MPTDIRRIDSLAIVVIAVFCVVSCSKSSDQATQAITAQNLQNALSPYTIEQAKQKAEVEAKAQALAVKLAALPKPELATPDSVYVDLHSGNQLMFLYAANSGLPQDYEKLASAYSNDYRSTTDAFRKHDLLAALKPKLDAVIADAKAKPYVTWTDSNPNIGHFDFNLHVFPNTSALFQQGGYVSFFDNGNFNLAVTNGQSFQQLHVADETRARTIEAMVGNWNSLRMKIFAFVQSTDDSRSPTVQAVITKVQLLDQHGQVLLEQKAE